ncbi:CRISPR-associated endonuclease Cas2 [Vibrio spartinae]|uniref:CRISPR-associated endonuclease Cas2 n=1 Tax=Vibrio spartinae TaxID=1918945 RepID=UPI001E3E341A|nr:CRISPR-associated endonuclease Cas2 [Vibrio spartinae]
MEDDKKRRRLSNLLLSYGERVQYSVFEITLRHDKALDELKKRCQKYVEPTDSLRFYWLPYDARKGSFDIHGNSIATFPQAEIL